jgi:hypothetical protein
MHDHGLALLATPPSKRTQTWLDQTAFPFIFDTRPRPTVWLGDKIAPKDGNQPRAWLCPDTLTAIALWCWCLEKYCGSKLKPPLTRNIQSWLDEMAPKEPSLIDAKQLMDFSPLCTLPPELMKRAQAVRGALFATRHEHERKATEESRRYAEEMRAQNTQERKKKQDAEAKQVALHEQRVRELQEQAEEERQRLIRLSLEQKQREELSGGGGGDRGHGQPSTAHAPWLDGLEEGSADVLLLRVPKHDGKYPEEEEEEEDEQNDVVMSDVASNVSRHRQLASTLD